MKIENLAAATYDIEVRYNNLGDCTLPLETIEIKAPTPVTVLATVTTEPTCTTGATITASAAGGTPAYEYELRESDGVIIVKAFSNNNGIFTDVPTGDYLVYARDAKLCISAVGAPVSVIAPTPPTATLDPTVSLCYDGINKVKLIVNVSGGVTPYSYAISPNVGANAAPNQNTFDVLPGSYSITVTDANGCIAEIKDINITPTLRVKVESVGELRCETPKDATIKVTVSGGTAPYKYTVNGGADLDLAIAGTISYEANTSGDYIFLITDAIGCSTTTTATVTELAVPIATPNKTDITCNNYNDGTITLTGSNGFGTYKYAIDKGAGFVYEDTGVFTGLATGIYPVRVKDSKGCESVVVNVTIENPTPVTATISATDLACSSTGTKAAIVTIKDAAGGAGGYTYSFNGNTNYTTANTFSTTTAGTISAYVKDKNGCEVRLPDVVIAALSGPTGIDVFFETGLECPAYIAHVKFQTIGGQSPIRYQVINVASGASIPLEASGQYNLPPGDYTFTAIDKNDCSFTLDYNVKSVPDITAGGSVLTPIKCFGDKGKIEFTVTGVKDRGYDYVITNAAGITIQSDNNISETITTVVVPTALPAGVYTIVAKDRKTNCPSEYTVELTQPMAALSASYVTVNANCEISTSKVTVTAVNGTAPYTYAYMIDGVAPAIGDYVPGFTSNLDPSTSLLWDVWVKDANGCIFKLDVIIAKDSAPTVTASVTDQCTSTGNSFKIKAVGSGGVAPYTYTISSGATPSPADTFTVTSTGKYTITVRDANNCTATTEVTVYGVMTASAVLTKDLTCGPIGATEAIITINAGGGLAPYSYRVSNDGGANYITTGITGNTFKTNIAGNYQFEVTDSNDPACIKISNVVKVTPAETVTATFNKVDPNCFNSSDGSISLTALTGEAPFTYSIDNGTSFFDSNVFGGLTAGTYNYIVRDDKGCDAQGNILLANPTQITPKIDIKGITCDVNTLGSFDVSVLSGGVAPFTYKLYDNSYNLLSSYVEAGVTQPAPPALPIATPPHKFSGLTFGDYYITIVDASGCEFKSAKLRIATPPYLTLTGTIADSGSCKDGVDVTVTTSGGVPDYKYSIFGQAETAPITSNSYTFVGLKHGTKYFLQVKDVNGCISILEIDTPASPSGIEITAVTATNVTCTGTATGTLAFTVSGYDLAVTDIYYEVLNALTLMPLATPINGTLSGAAGGPITKDSPALSLFAGNYVLRVSEVGSTECSATYPFEITQAAQPLTSIIKTEINATCNADAQVILETKGGTTAYKYAVGAPGFVPAVGDFGTSNVLKLSYATRTSWDIVVKDASGCEVRIPHSILLDSSPVIDLTVTDLCVAEGAFEIVVSENVAGVGPYSISVNTPNAYQSMTGYPGTPYKLAGLNSGVYDIYVKDRNGCVDMKSVTILAPLSVSPYIDALPTCTPDNDGKITLTPSGGSGSFTYDISPEPVTTVITANVISGLPAGTYTVTISDTFTGCSSTTEVKLAAPTAVTFTTAVDMVSCNGTSDGAITVNLPATNDNPVYTYEISPMPVGAVQVDNVFSKLPSGTYTITVRSGRGCSASDSTVFVGTPTTLTTTATVIPFGCNTSNTPQDALVTITIPTTGTAPYTYSFNGGPFGDDNTFAVGTSQRVDYVVLDKNGCMFTDFVMVAPFTPPIDMTIVATPIYCNTANGESTVTVTEVILKGGVIGTGTYTYEIIAPIGVAIPNTTGEFSKLLPGVYQIKVTDATGCSKVKTINIEKSAEISVDTQLLSNVFCKSDATGSIAFTISNYILPVDYRYDLTTKPAGATATVTNVGDVITYTGLIEGNYSFTVTDNISGCEKTVDFSIAEPAAALDFTTTATNINCDKKLATIAVTATGGTESYGYAVVKAGDPAPTVFGSNKVLEVDTNNGADMNWVVYVQDANGCPKNSPVTIIMDALPVIDAAVAVSQCPSPTATYDIKITATGVGTLEYSIGSGFTTNSTITVGAPGIYDVTVRDKNGCINPVPFPVTILDPLQLGIKEITEPKCNDPKGIVTLEATGGSGVANYQYKLGSTGTYGPSNIFPNLTPGIAYTFFVQDTGTPDLCEAEVTITIPLATVITLFEATPTAVTCKGGSDGVIEVTMETPAVGVNDNPIYTYALSGTDVLGNTITRPAQESELFANLPAGEYTVTVTSGRGCEAQETAVVDEPDLIVVPVPVVDGFGCTAGNTLNFATISVDPNAITGGSTDYVNYEFIKGTTQVYFGPNNVYTEYDLSGGTYTVNVYDSKGCVGSSAASVTIDPYIRLESADVTVTTAITCLDGESIQVNATTNSATAPVLDYAITDAAGNAVAGNPNNQDGIFTALPIGNYIITVSNPDTGCSIQTVHYVNNPNTFVLKAVKTSDVICFGSNEGTVELTIVDNQTNPDDEAGAFSYILTRPDGTTDNGNSPDKGPFTLTGLTAGLYSVKATLDNSPFCCASTSFTIVQPAAALDIKETHTAITCVAGNNDGSISVSATGGWPGGYEFEVLKDGNPFIGYTTQTEFTGLTAGIYRINVKDSKGCVDFVDVELKNPDPIIFTATLSAAVVSCYGDTSENIEVTTLPTGGSGSYLYTLISTFADGTVTSNGPQISPIFPNLGAGEYVVKVTDSWNCSAVSATFTISEPTKVVASLVVKTTQTCDNLTVLELSATGGTPPYTYSADGTFTATGSLTTSGSFATSTTFPVPVGTYHYYVRDANGCTSYISNDIRIDPLETLVVNLDIQNAVINCKGDNTGVIVAHATGGLGNYVYTLLDGAGTAVSPAPAQTTPGRFDGLIAGFYQVKVESGDCNAVSIIVEIKEPLTALAINPIETNITCNGENNGRIELNASGGTGQIMYAISPRLDQFFDSGIFDELAVGIYQVVIQDENGCFIVHDFEITEPSLLSVSTVPDSVFPEICAGDNDGAFSIAIAGGTLPYSVSLNDPNGTYTTGAATQTEFDFTGLSGGNHFVFIRDANGCTTDWLVALPESVYMNPIAVVRYDCVNNAAANTVTITIDDSITNPADVDYALDGSADFGPSSVFTDLAPGTHYVTARHSNGCEQRTIDFEIIQVAPLTLVLNDGGLNEIVAVAAGGGGGYKYTLNGESYGSTSNFIIYKSGNYTVTVTDANGCVASATKYMEYIDVCIPNNFTPNGDGINDGWAPGCTVNYKKLTFDVFDRYGRKVGSYRLGQYWDGKYNGTELPSGDYWYVLRLNDVKDAREFVGHFTLYR